MLDSIRKIDAFAYNGKTYPSETAAIVAAVASRIGNNEAIARNITDSAKDLIPLLQRVVELQAPDPAIPPGDHPNTTRDHPEEDRGGCDCSANMAGNSGPHHPSCPMWKPVALAPSDKPRLNVCAGS